MKELVSIIVPAYNSEKTIQRCINSLLSQSYANIEVIIIDDGSTDNTCRICDNYTSNCNIVIVHKENEGVSAARNDGIEVARGEYLVFVDSDDEVGIDYIKQLMDWKEYDYVTSGFKQQLSDGTWKQYVFVEEEVEQVEIREHPRKYVGKYYFGSPWAKLYKRDLINKFNVRFDVKISKGEDTLFNMDYLEHIRNMKIVPYCEYYYYYYKNSLVRRKNMENCNWKIEVEKRLFDYFNKETQENREFFYNRWFTVLYELLYMLDVSSTEKELKKVFNNSFFKECIKWKKSYGSREEKILVFCMEKCNFRIYKYIISIISRISKIKGKLLEL